MNIIYVGDPITISLLAGQTVSVTTTGTVTVDCVSGLGLTAGSNIGSIHGSRVFGAFSADGVVRLTATVRNGSYQLNTDTSAPIESVTNTTGQTVLDDASQTAMTNVGALPRSMRLGVIATKGVVPSNSNTTNRQIMSRTPHVALQNITSMQVVFANWYVSANNTGELTAAGTATITASVEYPLGTIAGTFTFSGSASGSIPASTTITTDMLTGLNIPAGALFCIRSYFVGTAGIVFTDEKAGNTIQCATFGVTGVTDSTGTGGSFTDTQAGIAYRPVAIVGYTTLPTWALAGDSRVLGLNDIANDIYTGRGQFERAMGKMYGAIRLGAAGEQLQTVLIASGATNYAKRLALINAYCTHVLSDYGINDLSTGARTAAQVSADATAFCGLMGTKPVVWATLTPKTTSTDSWATTTNQTLDANSGVTRVTFNGLVRKGIAGTSGYIEVADVVESARDSGKWKADGSTANLWTSDGVHESQYACMQIEAAANVFRPVSIYR